MTATITTLQHRAPASTHYFAGVSHRPAARAQMEEECLANRLQEIEDRAAELCATPGAIPFPSDLTASLKARHERVTRAYWASVGRTMSSAVVGPANFPVARNNKRMALADRRSQEMLDDVARAVRRLEGAAFPFGLPGAPIRADDPQAVEKLTARIADVKASWEFTKQLAAHYRKNDWAAIGALVSPQALREAMKAHYTGFRPFRLSGFGAEVKRLEGRIADIQGMAARASVEREPVAGVVLVENADIGRVQLLFPAKPDLETHSTLRRRGFVYSRTNNAYQRPLNNAGIYAAEQVLEFVKGAG